MKKIALFGGSFNPPHDGHFQAMEHIYKELNVDEVWMMYSINWQKDPGRYAPLGHRMEMGYIMKSFYPDTPVIPTDIEEELGTHITYEVLMKLMSRFPDHQFIWVMGSDNLASFHTWEHADDIIENFPVAVIDRPPYESNALHSPTALTYPHLRAGTAKDLLDAGHGWCMIEGPQIEISSSHLLKELKQGRTHFHGAFQHVANYIRENNLYGIDAAEAGVSPSPLFI